MEILTVRSGYHSKNQVAVTYLHAKTVYLRVVGHNIIESKSGGHFWLTFCKCNYKVYSKLELEGLSYFSTFVPMGARNFLM